MRSLLLYFASILLFTNCTNPPSPTMTEVASKIDVLVNLCIKEDKITSDWREVLSQRQSSGYLDSLENVKRALTTNERDWFELIKSRSNAWTSMRDSLNVPFEGIGISDTVYVFLGYLGSDDAFSFQFNTVCFDLTALDRAYGSAKDSVNTNRIDRIFAHEYTHLLSKEWGRQTGLVLSSFRDSILWECMYEGMGMYRSMSSRWFPQNRHLSTHSEQVLSSLYPLFSERLSTIESSPVLSAADKKRLQRNLSAGSMNQKWGALPVAVWLALEADGNDRNLIKWVNMGPEAVILLGRKYLTGEARDRFEDVFGPK